MQAKSKNKLLGSISATILVVFTSFLVWVSFFNGAQAIEDWWWLRSYVPSAEIEQLAVDGSYTEEATNVFYLSDPKLIVDGDVFNKECNEKEELSIVLGCFTAQKEVFVFNVGDDRLPDVEEVTAAHEMLHVAWDRFSPDKKNELGLLLERQLESIQDKRLNDLVQLYRENIFCDNAQLEGADSTFPKPDCTTDASSQQDSFNSELHSIIGTELSEVDSSLEDHYATYFKDRQIVVAKAQGYAQTFIDIEQSISKFDEELEGLGNSIDKQQAELASLSSEISTREQQLISLREGDQVSEYNALVPVFNQLVNSYNADVNNYENTVSSYNALVKKRNQQAYVQRDLVNSINSNFSTR